MCLLKSLWKRCHVRGSLLFPFEKKRIMDFHVPRFSPPFHSRHHHRMGTMFPSPSSFSFVDVFPLECTQSLSFATASALENGVYKLSLFLLISLLFTYFTASSYLCTKNQTGVSHVVCFLLSLKSRRSMTYVFCLLQCTRADLRRCYGDDTLHR